MKGSNAMNTIKLKKPYTFEGTEYTELDLSGLEKLTVQDAINAQGRLAGEPGAAIFPERSTAFVALLAAKATELPVEFFELLPVPAAKAVRAALLVAMNAEKQADGMKMQLEEPYLFKGKQYEEVDLSGVADLTAMDMTMAENEMARAGQVAAEPALNFYYCCLMAARASGLPKEFFTGLPLKETTKIKTTMNDDRFFG